RGRGRPLTPPAGPPPAPPRLDPLLGDFATVILTGPLDLADAPLLAEHVDRAIAIGMPPFSHPSLEIFDAADTGWLGRHIARTKLGLALGAGGAKGFAHIGALYELEAAGYTVDYVGGSSIGVIVGACIAMGLDAAATEQALRTAFTRENVTEMFAMTLAGSSGLDTLKAVLQGAFGERTFADLGKPLIAMTVDLVDRSPWPITSGAIWEAMVAATAL